MNSKIALVTGGARRIGAEIVRTLHENGYGIVLHYCHAKEEATKLADFLNEKRVESVITFQADLQHTEKLEEMISQTIAKFGRLDVLVNNASRFYKTKLGCVTEALWDELQESNVKGAFFLSQAAFPLLQERQGCIVNLIDIHAKKPLKNYSVYCIAKAGLAMLTHALAKEMAPLVRVNGVSPGAILWPEENNELSEKDKTAILQKIPLGKQGKPQDIANAVLFCIENAYMTGEIISIDGGRSL